MTFRPYSPLRVWSIFRILLTLFLLIRKRERFLLFKPLSPEHLTYAITKLGASFIKLAQVLATRNDFFPPSYLSGLKSLHDALPPMNQNTMQMVFDRAFVQNPFQKFEQNPIASASIGQVHIAWLHDGTKVAVKLRREGIARQVNADILISPCGELILLDFGMVKRVPNETRIAIIELLKAANEQDYERYINASKRLGTVTYDAPVATLAEFTESMFEIFSNDALDSGSMQQLAFEVLERTRDLPFKLPQEAIYILRVSAIIEGLGTTYIENFNGIKDILPILQHNIPRALGAKESIFETIIDEFKQLPMDIKAFKTAIYKVSEEQIRVELFKNQLEAIQMTLNQKFQQFTTGITLIFASLFLLLYDRSYENISLALFAFGVWKIWHIKS